MSERIEALARNVDAQLAGRALSGGEPFEQPDGLRALLAGLGEPLMSSTLILPNEELPLADAHEIRARLEHELDLVIDAGPCGFEPTTVVLLEEGAARVLRQGKGDPAPFQA